MFVLIETERLGHDVRFRRDSQCSRLASKFEVLQWSRRLGSLDGGSTLRCMSALILSGLTKEQTKMYWIRRMESALSLWAHASVVVLGKESGRLGMARSKGLGVVALQQGCLPDSHGMTRRVSQPPLSVEAAIHHPCIELSPTASSASGDPRITHR